MSRARIPRKPSKEIATWTTTRNWTRAGSTARCRSSRRRRPWASSPPTDAGSVKDMEAFAKQTGNELLSSQPEGKEYVFFLKKK